MKFFPAGLTVFRPGVVALGILLCALALPATWAHGQEAAEESESAMATPPTVDAIEIQGLYRITPESVQRHIRQRPGKALDRDAISDDIKRIYRSGFFDDVQVGFKVAGENTITLLYLVKERPTIDSIRYEGNDELDEEDLGKVVDIRKFAILSIPQIERNLTKIRELYVEDGYYLADVEYELQKKADNLVDLVFQIQEGREVKVKTITILGNKHIDDATLKGSIFTREGSLFSFLTGAGQFKAEAFRRDLEILKFLYQDQGYIDIKIDEPVVTLSRDKQSMHITLRVEEGEAYTVGKVGVIGDLLLEEEEMLDMLQLKEGDLFRRSLIINDSTILGNLYKDKGFANVSISNQPRIDKKARTMDFTYVIQKGDPVHFRFIEFRGNAKTRDKVLRRELLFTEGSLYNETAMRRSEQEIMRLGYFTKATVRTKNTSNPSQVDVVVKVEEMETGSFQLGAGFSSLESFILQAQISKQNLFGNGQYLAFQANLSRIRTLFKISFYEPYFLDQPFTLGFNVYNFDTQYNDFSRKQQGGDISFGYRFNRDFTATITYKLEHKEAFLGGGISSPSGGVSTLSQNGITSSVRGSLSLDTRDNRLFPTRGWFLQGSVEWADQYLGSENQFVRLDSSVRWYIPVFWKLIFKTNAEIGYVTSTDGTKIPLFERYLMGGIQTIRGFEFNSIGPTIDLSQTPDPTSLLRTFHLGGNKKLLFNAELELPIFEALKLRLVGFFDMGQAYDESELIDLSKLRMSSGFGIRWFSPVGPLRFEWGFPIDRKKDEEPVVFEFNIGNSF